MQGKSALVTGGGGGFGKAIAELLLADGAAVTLADNDVAKLDAARDLLSSKVAGAKIATIAGDATSEADVQAAIDAAIAHGGGLDIVVGTVGGGSGFGAILDMPYDTFLSDYALNVGSAFLLVKQATPLMRAGSSFVFISSAAAVTPLPNLVSYCTVKAGLDHFTRSAAIELSPRGIRFNAVRPGTTETDGMAHAFARDGFAASSASKIPLARTGKPFDIAKAVHYLASDDASWITGQCWTVDGGAGLRTGG
ncbi:SDR family NAD(P)-dependent oxidoreductase [Sphingomonas montanisoli]|uniref:SDR family oxidoreductase n=1 Tax=Sphingomonas montanisoli TaxID=2606412 RepID=A0A5D9BXK5_9SPHN|nr:SDR family oxidoreductase [Sphingomonas montanisoli]TZG24134.1 SDR family oxidoreductase [Sphingomonas montanisoli]